MKNIINHNAVCCVMENFCFYCNDKWKFFLLLDITKKDFIFYNDIQFHMQKIIFFVYFSFLLLKWKILLFEITTAEETAKKYHSILGKSLSILHRLMLLFLFYIFSRSVFMSPFFLSFLHINIYLVYSQIFSTLHCWHKRSFLPVFLTWSLHHHYRRRRREESGWSMKIFKA